jgi:hypothetical protein
LVGKFLVMVWVGLSGLRKGASVGRYLNLRWVTERIH